MNLEEKILKRIEELKQIREQTIKKLEEEGLKILSPLDSVLAELESILKEEN